MGRFRRSIAPVCGVILVGGIGSADEAQILRDMKSLTGKSSTVVGQMRSSGGVSHLNRIECEPDESRVFAQWTQWP
jgi:hypothetical protein